MLMVVWYLTFNEQWLTFGEMYLLVYNLIFFYYVAAYMDGPKSCWCSTIPKPKVPQE